MDLALRPGQWVPYHVAWVGGCTLYRRDALVEAGGFTFWRILQPNHAGEDVLAQWQVMERLGGAGILPSGAVHLESPTNVMDRGVEAFDVVLGNERESADSEGPWTPLPAGSGRILRDKALQ